MLRFVELPCAGEHASIFIGVGVAEHDFVGASPGIEQGLEFGIAPDAAHDARREARRASIDSNSGTGIRPGSALLAAMDTPPSCGELHDGEDVVLGLRVADDEIADGFGRVRLLYFCNGAEGVDEFGGFRREFFG